MDPVVTAIIAAVVTVLTSGAAGTLIYKLAQLVFAWWALKNDKGADDVARVVLAFQGKGRAGPTDERVAGAAEGAECTVLEREEAKDEPPALPPAGGAASSGTRRRKRRRRRRTGTGSPPDQAA